MGRRSDHSRKELKELAIKKGSEIIELSGLQSLSARKVATEIGYTVGTLYNIFSNFDDFLLHINASTLDDMAIFIEGEIKRKKASNKTGKNGILVLAHIYRDYAEKNKNRWAAVFGHSFPDEMPIPDWYNEKVEGLFSLVEGMLAGAVSDKKIHLTARALWAGIHGAVILGITDKLRFVGEDGTEDYIDVLVENFFEGIKS